MKKSIKSLCPYCGVGCGLEIISTNEKDKVIGDRSHISNQGMVCVKGATILDSLNENRLEYPMFRESLTDSFRRITWEEAFNLIVERIKIVRSSQGVDAICIYGSGQMQTEDYYVAQKLLKGCLGTNNFDSNSRLCMSSAVASYVKSFGSDGQPCCYEDLDVTDCAFIIGSNTAECHPIIFNRLHKHIKKSPTAKIIVVDPRRTKTAEVADLHLAIKPGTDINLLNGIAYLLWRWHGIDKDFIENHTNGFGEYLEVIKHYPPQVVAEQCGISQKDLEQTARYWLESGKVLSLWSQGINQSSEGTAKARTLINLHLMTGQIGKPGAGPFSLTGQPNAMGGRESGGYAHILPGYRMVKNERHRAEVEQVWGLKSGSISAIPGKDAWQMITELETGEVGLFWVVATNPAVSMPDLERTKKALLKSPFTICQDAYYPTETANYAHLVLPAAQWSEKAGIMTNSERVVTFCPQFRNAPQEAKADWEIFAEVGRRLGFEKQFYFANSAEVYDEFVSLTKGRLCDMSGLSHKILAKHGAIQWPFPEGSNPEDNYGRRLYTNFSFPTPDGRARFSAYHSRGLAEPPHADYPLVLTIGRLYGHWHTMTRTGHIPKIMKMHPEPLLEINPKDASKLSISDGEYVEVRSRRGRAYFKVKVTAAITRGTVFAPMHWGALWAENAEANSLTHPESCPDSKQPELKACAVRLVKTTNQFFSTRA